MGINQSINQLMTYDMTIYDMTYGHLERDVYGWTGGESRSPNIDAAARNKESLCATLCPPWKAWMMMIHTRWWHFLPYSRSTARCFVEVHRIQSTSIRESNYLALFDSWKSTRILLQKESPKKYSDTALYPIPYQTCKPCIGCKRRHFPLQNTHKPLGNMLLFIGIFIMNP